MVQSTSFQHGSLRMLPILGWLIQGRRWNHSLVLAAFLCHRLEAALDLEILATEPFTGDYFLEEIKGLADATGLDYKVSCTGE